MLICFNIMKNSIYEKNITIIDRLYKVGYITSGPDAYVCKYFKYKSDREYEISF